MWCYVLKWFVVVWALFPAVKAATPLWHQLDESYSFERFVEDFDKLYSSENEYSRRKVIFEENRAAVMQHNKQKRGLKQGHVLGINQFADLHHSELPTGFNKGMHRSWSSHGSTSSRKLLESFLTVEPVSSLPESVDWRSKRVTTPVKYQGSCGSCWAFATTAALESHIALRTGKLFALSEQELVSCAPNPQHCGGEGGCTGSIAEIAMEHVRKHGMVQEWAFGYASVHGENVTCILDASKNIRGGDDALYEDAVATIEGYAALESNSYPVLMNVVAKLGPVAVSVAASTWHLYSGGVFYAPLNNSRSTNVNHLVVLEGYGTDSETGEDYWLVRNSYSPLWGEGGYIRLKRVDPSTLDDPDADCGMDVTPADGTGCSKDANGNDIIPPAAKICGTSGILYASAVPLGGRLV